MTHIVRCVIFNIHALYPKPLSLWYDPHTIATLPAADSHTVAGYHAVTVWTLLAMLSIFWNLPHRCVF